jgi:AcrR family transcriptional regulator
MDRLPLNPVVEDILTVAVSEFAAHGLAGARVDAIAARTRTSKRMLYYHFGSKEGLYAAALDHAFRVVRQAEPDYDALPPLEALRAWVGFVFDAHVRHPEFVRMVMGENLVGGRFLREAEGIVALNRAGLELPRRILQRGQAEGSMRADVRPIDLYTNTVALCFYFVSNRHTFSAIFEPGIDARDAAIERRRVIIDTMERQVAACQA